MVIVFPHKSIYVFFQYSFQFVKMDTSRLGGAMCARILNIGIIKYQTVVSEIQKTYWIKFVTVYENNLFSYLQISARWLADKIGWIVNIENIQI